MNIGSLTKSANNLAEESFSSSQIVEFVNDAIAKINIEREANFPFMSLEDSGDYAGFPEKWQRALFIPFVVGRMKAVDASQFEYSDNYNEFAANLLLFKTKFPVPAEYQDENEKKSFEPDFTGIYWSWGGSGTNGSDPLS
jgi:hypothetical protein